MCCLFVCCSTENILKRTNKLVHCKEELLEKVWIQIEFLNYIKKHIFIKKSKPCQGVRSKEFR